MYDGRAIGSVTHQAIARLVQAGAVEPKPADVFPVVAAFVRDLPALPYRRAAQQRLAANIALYFHYYPPASDWQLDGVEVKVPGAVIDLLWRTPDQALIADEIKTGRYKRVPERRMLERQVEAICRGANGKYGDRFIGVREALLLSPATACFVSWDGTRTPIGEVDWWS